LGLRDGLLTYLNDSKVVGRSSGHKAVKKVKLGSSNFLSIGELVEARKVAQRRGVWFRVLNRVERGIVDLTVKVVDCIKSGKLAKMLEAIVEKLQLALEDKADKLVRTIGLPLARKISNLSVRWRNLLVSKWAEDRVFAMHLAYAAVSPTYFNT
jgi:hypothetical protein